MKKIIWFSLYLLLYTVTVVFYSSCSDDESPLRNDLLRKDAGPVLVGNTLEFAYAICFFIIEEQHIGCDGSIR